MPVVAFLHTHVLVVILFLILFLVKAVLLFLNKHDLLNKVRSGTKVLDMIFGALILITGGYLLFKYNGVPAWLWVKVVLVLLAIPLGIAGLKRHNKVLTAITLFIFAYVYGVAETKSLTMQKEEYIAAEPEETVEGLPGYVPEQNEPPVSTSVDAPGSDEAVNKMAGGSGHDILEAMDETQLANAKAIYQQQCAVCHGNDGRKGLGNAKDLTKSSMSQQARIDLITKGKGLMPPFKGKLSDQEIEAVAAYTATIK
ncbi:MAG: SirB2 family protein [Hymenobacteraceae bacterium]|nr:SirB2 family protein [Hymenobacteraceae bacterium]MDX5395017.1 SirB2 family protein [Hymenobacteraceae bacterium]MDX5511049.1 SirB2 family protein [Hymenobacteraceae bacterium]